MVDAISTSLSGIQNAGQKIDKAAKNIADPEKFQENGGIEDIIDIKVAEIEYKANLEVLETTGELQDELLKVFDEKV